MRLRRKEEFTHLFQVAGNLSNNRNRRREAASLTLQLTQSYNSRTTWCLFTGNSPISGSIYGSNVNRRRCHIHIMTKVIVRCQVKLISDSTEPSFIWKLLSYLMNLLLKNINYIKKVIWNWYINKKSAARKFTWGLKVTWHYQHTVYLLALQ